MDDQELVTTACPLIGRLGAAFYFTPATRARGQELGLNAIELYFLGRGGVLGDVEPAVVSSAFGYFNHEMVQTIWNAARAKASPRDAGRLFAECCAEFGREKLSSVDGLADFVAAGDKVLAACDGDGLALFAGVAAEPMVDDLPGRAMQIITVLREYRGSAHLVALRAVGVATKDAHFVKRPDDVAMFGWAEDAGPAIDDDLLARMGEAEALTDRIVTPAFAVLDDTERRAFVDGLHAVAAALAG